MSRKGEDKADAVHSHDDCDILDMVKMGDQVPLEKREHFFYSHCQQILALLV